MKTGTTIVVRASQELAYQFRYGIPVWIVTLLTSWLPDVGPAIRLRGFLVSLFLPGRPRYFALGRDVTLLSLSRLRIGSNVYIAKGCWLNAIGGITFDDEVVLGPYVVMSSTNHGFDEGSVQRGGAHPAPISVGWGSWIATHAVVTAGTSVGSGVVVAANSVVTKDTGNNEIVAGIPAVRIGSRTDNPSNIKSKHDAHVG